MTYYESYTNCASFEQAIEQAKRDVLVAATILGNNQDRIKAIQDAINKAEAYFRERRDDETN